MRSSKISDAQLHIDGKIVAQMIMEFHREFDGVYLDDTMSSSLCAVGPLQSMIGLAISNGLLALPPASEGRDNRWFELSGDARLGRCATEGCGGQPSWRLEAGGVGANYCSGCAASIHALSAPKPVAENAFAEYEGVTAKELAATVARFGKALTDCRNALYLNNRNNGFDEIIASAVQALKGSAPKPVEGWRWVPEQPTEEQMQAGLYQASHDAQWADVYSIYVDMVRAAPPASAPKPQGEAE